MGRVIAFLLVSSLIGKEEQVVREIAELSDEITEVRATLGQYDIIAKIETSSQESLTALVTMVRKLPHITSTTTLVAIPHFGGR